MEQRLENSTLIALRELRSYEQERQLAERRKREEEARQARERKERERKEEEAARERALETQLRADLQRAEEEILLLKHEADRRMHEATHALQALQVLARVPQSPAPTSTLPARRGKWLAASGATALLASVVVLIISARSDLSSHTEAPRRNSPGVQAVAPLPKPVAQVPSTEVANAQSIVSGPVESGIRRPPTPHPRRPGTSLPIHKPNPPKPICDGRDPLCGLSINSMGP